MRDPWCGGVAKNLMSGHKLYRPSLQALFDQHGTPGSKATLSPTCNRCTPGPTSVITLQ
jgi:hypothetical protein